MKADKKNQVKKTDSVAKILKPSPIAKNQDGDQEIEVLYQKLGNRWYAFSMIDDEVFYGNVSDDTIASKQRNETPEHNE